MPYIELPNAFESLNNRNFKYSDDGGGAHSKREYDANGRDSDGETVDNEDQFFNKNLGNLNVTEIDNATTIHHHHNQPPQAKLSKSKSSSLRIYEEVVIKDFGGSIFR